MNAGRKADSKIQQLKGKAKEAAGRLTGDRRLAAEGRADHAEGKFRQAGHTIMDVFRKR
ncbi:CsbD family protein [Marinactinospora thermotolerans]|uniref:Uncharacterized conserved protein YjbJ, UPF0337 family n=1 Tax=Marinactinospora thermotolerans DSM 45154 TaxID=1122192 RepID=A0A1T4SXQ3_9ACTN|nr:CsbD family protein [Marinactinospora thermotolerans]SKA32966.1 Uncharacterized conserved protein YjbJ, UPF0337 family [Marinactinospora thermotolerans DSM 45154]